MKMINKDRRNFLRFALLGTGIFLANKVFSKQILEPEKKLKTIEENGQTVFLNRKGKRVFAINDKGEIEVG